MAGSAGGEPVKLMIMAVSAPGSSILLNNGAEIVSRRVGMRLAHFRDNSIRATEEGETFYRVARKFSRVTTVDQFVN